MIYGSVYVFYRVVYKPKLLRINKFTWNKFYVEALGNISALEALNASKLNTIILNDILHFLGPIGFEKIMSVSNKLINLLLGGSVVSYLVLNSWTLFLVVVLNRRALVLSLSLCQNHKLLLLLHYYSSYLVVLNNNREITRKDNQNYNLETSIVW